MTRKKRELLNKLRHLPYLKLGERHFMRVDVTYKGRVFFQMVPNVIHGATYAGFPLGNGPFTGMLIGDGMEYFNPPELEFREIPTNTIFYSEEEERAKEARFWEHFMKKVAEIRDLARKSIWQELRRLHLIEAYRDFIMYRGAKTIMEGRT